MTTKPDRLWLSTLGVVETRRGSVLVYCAVTMTLILGLVSLAVDFGRAETVKTELQRCADATALGAVDAYADTYNQATAGTVAMTIAAQNVVDSGSGVSPTITMTGGTWDPATRTFSTSYAPGWPAAKVVASRTKANGNPLALTFGKAVGITSLNIQATAIAVLIDSGAQNVSVPGTANTYLAGMPNGSGTAWGDNTNNAKPFAVNGIAVVPGTWITLTGATGSTCILPGYTGTFGPDGEATRLLHHNQNYDGSDWGIGPENGIGDAIIPGATFTGVFLTDNPPTARSAPALADWSSASSRDQTAFSNLQVQSPFPIGDGKTTGGTVQRFLVPPGATRLYLSIWDGTATSNNSGTINATMNLKHNVRLVD